MTGEEWVLAVAVALISGSVGAVVGARIQARSAKDAATIAAEAAGAVGELQARESAANRVAEHRAWINDRTREIADELMVLIDRHRRQVGAQYAGRDEAAKGVIAERQIPAVGSTDPIRDLVIRLSNIADERVAAAAWSVYKSSVDIGRWAYDARRHFDGENVVGMTTDEKFAWNETAVAISTKRDALRNAVRVQLGQPALTEPDPFGEEAINL
jgi:hypothetical protein